MQDFKKLEIYDRANQITFNIYKVTASFPKTEKYGVVQQIRRAATSIGANIAEGCGRKTNADFLRFLYNSMGSIKEIEHFLLISKKLDYISKEEYSRLNKSLESLARKLNCFMNKLYH